MRRVLFIVFLIGCGACRSSSEYLFLWAGDADHKASDFLAVIDANPTSARYGAIVASIPTGVAGAHPHHTEQEMPAHGHLLANGFHAGRTWLFDLSQPLHPRVLTSFGDVAGYSTRTRSSGWPTVTCWRHSSTGRNRQARGTTAGTRRCRTPWNTPPVVCWK